MKPSNFKAPASGGMHNGMFSTENVMTLWELIRKPTFIVSQEVLDTIDIKSALLVKRGDEPANTSRDLLVRGMLWGSHFYSVMRIIRPSEVVAVSEFIGAAEPDFHAPTARLYGIFVNRDDNISITTGPYRVEGDLGLKGKMRSFLLCPEAVEGRETFRDIGERLADGAGRVLNALGYTLKEVKEMKPMSPEGKITYGFTFARG